jgi:Transposase DDE domain
MDDTITTIYCLCDEFLKATGHRHDPQARLSTAEVMTVPLVAAAFFGGNVERSRRFLREYGYVPTAISKSRFNRRIHAIEPELWRALFSALAAVFKRGNTQGIYAVDSLPVAACDNIRIRRCRLYPPEEHAGAFRGYIASKRRYFYGLRVHLVVTQAGEPVEFALAAGSEADVSVFSRTWSWTCPRARSSVPTRLTPTTTTRTFWRKLGCTSKPSARRIPNGRCLRGRSSWASQYANTSKRSSAG